MEGGVEMSVEGAAASRNALAARMTTPWRALVAAVLLSALAVALWQGLAATRSSVVPAARLHASSHLRSRASAQKASAQKKKGLSSLPVSAQGPISEALGADNPAYRVSAAAGGFSATSPTQHFRASFARSGVTFSSASARVGLSLKAVGYGSSMTALGEVAPRVKANRVFYERKDLSEWYANGPLGLEQGFTIPQAPAGHPAGALTLSMALSGNAHASLGAGAQSITLSRAGRPVASLQRPERHRRARTRAAQLASAAGGACAAARRHDRRALPAADRPVRPAG